GENVKVTVIATGFDLPERMAALDHGARAQVPQAPVTVPSMHVPQPMMTPRHAQPVYSSHSPSRMDPHAPAFSNRRIQQAPPMRDMRETHESRVQPASGRIPVRERTSNFPAFDTDWDVPAFQRKGQ